MKEETKKGREQFQDLTKRTKENEKKLTKREFRCKKIICPLCWIFSVLPKWPLFFAKTKKQKSNGQRGRTERREKISLFSLF